MTRVGLMAVLLLAAASGCPGSIEQPVRRDQGTSWPDLPIQDYAPAQDHGGTGDASALDHGADGGFDAASPCKPDDAMTPCDPIAPSGCPPGAGCYLVGGKYLDCICPAGTLVTGGTCNTTAECSPGHACAGTQPPGTCMRMCLPSAPACPGGTTCTPIPAVPQFGVCQ